MVLGVTGGIATGKSSVASMFAQLGAAVVSADKLAREAVAPGTDVLADLAARFGEKIIADDGTLDRAALSEIVFTDSAARDDLNRLIHPAIARLAEERLSRLRQSGKRLIVYEAPLLFEAGAESRVDRVLVVVADPDTQLGRLVKRDEISRLDARNRIDSQMALADKAARADYVIDNSGSEEQTYAQVRELFNRLVRTDSQ